MLENQEKAKLTEKNRILLENRIPGENLLFPVTQIRISNKLKLKLSEQLYRSFCQFREFFCQIGRKNHTLFILVSKQSVTYSPRQLVLMALFLDT